MILNCDNNHGRFCQAPEYGCQSIGKIFAHDLKLFKSKILEKEEIKKNGPLASSKQLHCYFSDFSNLESEKIDL